MLRATKSRASVLSAVMVLLWGSLSLALDASQHQMWEYLPQLEAKAYQMSEDFGPPPFYDCALQYYYYVPCPSYSWFWAYSGWEPGDILGARFKIGDQGTGGFDPCDPLTCFQLGTIRVLDFAGYGTVYPGLFTLEMDVYCSDEGPSPYQHLWNSGPLEAHFGWNYFQVSPPVNFFGCGEPLTRYPVLAVTMTMTGTGGEFPAVGFDNISTAVETGCLLHDTGCMPAVYPRTWAGGEGARVHSGYVGTYPFQYWPPHSLPDGIHTGPESFAWYGFVEVAWRLYITCQAP